MTTLTFGQRSRNDEQSPPSMSDKVVKIRRVSKVVKGGRRLSFSALVAVGDSRGRVGVGLGKSDAIPDAVRKAGTNAQKALITVTLRNTSIPHVVRAKYGAALVLLKPAPAGTGIIAGPSMRAVLEMAGVKDVVTKSLGSQNPINVARATMVALKELRNVQKARPAPATDSTTEEPEAASWASDNLNVA